MWRGTKGMKAEREEKIKYKNSIKLSTITSLWTFVILHKYLLVKDPWV